MRTKIAFLLILSTIALFGCDFPNILSGSDDSRDPNGDENATADTLLYVHITGGFAGVNQTLLVRESGMASFTDSFRGGAEWRTQLSSNEIKDIKKLILTNGFLLLEEEQYSDPQVADAFFYDIQAFGGDESHRVLTDNFGAPDNLKNVVEGILELIESITERGLNLELMLGASEIEQGDTVELILRATNESSGTITLRFNSGQIFDFCAFRHTPGVMDSLIWNWAHDQIFTQQLQEIELAAGESRSYKVEWGGRNNEGELVTGDFSISGKLMSLPGGATQRKFLQIVE